MGELGQEGHQQLASPRRAPGKAGHHQAEVSSLKGDTLQVGCALFPIPRSDLCSVAKSFLKEALRQQGRGSLNQICFPSQISTRPSEALGPTSEVLKLFNTQAVAKQRLFCSNNQCRALL